MPNKPASSVVAYFVLVFALSIPFWVLDALWPRQLLPGLPLSALGALTTALAALFLAYRRDHLPGFWQLLGRTCDFRRIKPGWLLVILLVNPVMAVLAYGLVRAGGRPLPLPAPPTLGLLPMFAFFLIGALAEEVGWSGYATEPLQQRWGTALAGIGLGAVWAVWHFVPLLQAQRALAWIVWWSLGTIALRALMTWLYMNAGRSVFGAALFHAMINLCWQLFPVNGSYYDPRVFGLITLCLAVAVYAARPSHS